MALEFGTSGVRGLVGEMTDRECFLYTLAFCEVLKAGGASDAVAVAGDLRGSTPRILSAVIQGIRAAGVEVVFCGFQPTPTVTLYGMTRGLGSIMVTGSHIPDDRNGIKFNLPSGEVMKADERRISEACTALRAKEACAELFDEDGMLLVPATLPPVDGAAEKEYVARYAGFVRAEALAGMRVVLYQHSAVGREMLGQVLENAGAEVIRVGWSDRFVAVDTEAVAEPERLRAWVLEYEADALVSTDGDSDRPLVVDEVGEVMRGDELGIVVADALKADWVATPVSCNSALELSGRFASVVRTKIGSPYVIGGMAAGLAQGAQCVVGYEANGGFLCATPVALPRSPEPVCALPTRDAVLPILTLLASANAAGRTLSQLRADLPKRYTWSDLLRDFPQGEGQQLVALIAEDAKTFCREHLSSLGELAKSDFTDGARLTLTDGRVLHFRPSGNAPEFRCYTEADTEQSAISLNAAATELLRGTLHELVRA